MKRFISIMLTLSMLASMALPVFASNTTTTTKDSLPSGLGNINATIVGGADKIGTNILQAVKWIGYAFAVGMLIYVGIKYMMSSANEKADVKKGLINYVIGAVLVAGASTILGFIIGFANGFSSGNSTPS